MSKVVQVCQCNANDLHRITSIYNIIIHSFYYKRKRCLIIDKNGKIPSNKQSTIGTNNAIIERFKAIYLGEEYKRLFQNI